MSIRLKVMTFNLRICSEKDGDNHFLNRKERILYVINKEKPDLIGFQEADKTGLPYLVENLGEYYLLGHGRDSCYRGEAIPIAYRKDRFDLHSFHTEWLSLEPERPASRFHLDQGKCPRMYASAELIHHETNKPISFFNIHADNRGELARLLECEVLMRAVAASNYPYVLTGDFNARPDTASIGFILSTAERLGTVDATRMIPTSFCGFNGKGTSKIDYIFTNLKTDPAESYQVHDEDRSGRYYSDHFALCAFVELPEGDMD